MKKVFFSKRNKDLKNKVKEEDNALTNSNDKFVEPNAIISDTQKATERTNTSDLPKDQIPDYKLTPPPPVKIDLEGTPVDQIPDYKMTPPPPPTPEDSGIRSSD